MSELDEETARAGRRRGTIQSVDRAARILKALAGGPRRLGVSQLADQLGLPRPTVHGLLQTLQAHGFVEQDRDSDKYQLGPGLLHLGSSYLDLNELRARSLVHAERLAQRTGEAVRVGVLHGDARRSRPPRLPPRRGVPGARGRRAAPRARDRAGQGDARAPPRAAARGRRRPLPRLTNKTLNAHGLAKELDEIRSTGIAREKDEAVLGESSLAAPIADHSGHAVGAIGIVGETRRIFPRGPAKGLPEAVAEAARSVSRELGARGGLLGSPPT